MVLASKLFTKILKLLTTRSAKSNRLGRFGRAANIWKTLSAYVHKICVVKLFEKCYCKTKKKNKIMPLHRNLKNKVLRLVDSWN